MTAKRYRDVFVQIIIMFRNLFDFPVDAFRKKRGLKSLGMPHFVGHGSHEVNDKRHRFIVVPRFGADVWSLYLANDRKMPLHTAYRLAIQMVILFCHWNIRTNTMFGKAHRLIVV